MLYTFLVVVDTLLAIAVVVLILLNRGRGAEVGAAFGGGASGTVFGARGAAPFISKVIAVLAALFLVNSLTLAYLANFQYVQRSVVDEVGVETLQRDEEPAGDLSGSGTDDVPDEVEPPVNGSAPSDVPN